jgi:hypothetical protein
MSKQRQYSEKLSGIFYPPKLFIQRFKNIVWRWLNVIIANRPRSYKHLQTFQTFATRLQGLYGLQTFLCSLNALAIFMEKSSHLPESMAIKEMIDRVHEGEKEKKKVHYEIFYKNTPLPHLISLE